MVSAWLRSGRIQAMPSGTSCKAFSQWSFPWIRRLRREYVSNGDHGFLVFRSIEHLVLWSLELLYFFVVRREMFSEPPTLIVNRYQEKCYASGLTLEHVRWHYNDYTIQKTCICLEHCYIGHDMCIRDISLCAVSLSLSSQCAIGSPRWTLCWATEMM